MKNCWIIVSRFLTSFFFLFGLLEFLFFISGIFPHYGGLAGISFFHTLLCIAVSFVLTVSHIVISSEFLDRYISVKSRVIICGIACTIALGVLTVYYGIPSFVVHLLGLKNELAAATTWIIAFVFCLIIVMLTCWLIEKNFCRTGKMYDVALAAYKKKTEVNYGIDGFGCQ